MAMPFTVYVLKQKGEIVYIGQSRNVANRRRPNSRASIPASEWIYKQFDEVIEWRSYPSRKAAIWAEDWLQHAYIRKYGTLPKYNRGCALSVLGGIHSNPIYHEITQQRFWHSDELFPDELLERRDEHL